MHNNIDSNYKKEFLVQMNQSPQIPPQPPPSYKSIIKLFLLSTLLQSISTIYIKLLQNYYITTYSTSTFLLFRGCAILISIITYSQCTGNEITKINKLPHKKWIILNSTLSFISIGSFALSVLYLRCFTSQTFTIITSVTVVVISKFFFKEKLPFHRTLIGIICLIGVCIILLNEYMTQNKGTYFLGIKWSLLSLISHSLWVLLRQRVGMNLGFHIQSFYNQCFICGFSLLYMLLNKFDFIITPWYVVFSGIHGLNLFFVRYLNEILMGNEFALKYSWMNHLRLLYVMIMCSFISKDVYFLDLVGVCVVVGILVYDTIQHLNIK